MPPRLKSSATARPPVGTRASARPIPAPHPQTRRRSAIGPAAAKRWRRDVRPRLVRSAVSATKDLGWSPALVDVLLEELYVDDDLEELLGKAPRKLRTGQYPQAVAVALILRHSWRADDLACIVERLGLKATGLPVRRAAKPRS